MSDAPRCPDARCRHEIAAHAPGPPGCTAPRCCCTRTRTEAGDAALALDVRNCVACPACAVGLVTEPCERCGLPPAVVGGQGQDGSDLVRTSGGCLGLVFAASCFAMLACVVGAACWMWAVIQR